MLKSFSIDALFQEVVRRLHDENARYALAGGIAVSLYRLQKRTTEDLDFLIYVDGAARRSQQLAEEIIRAFGLKPGIARKADLEGGPLIAIKRKSTEPYMVIGRDPDRRDVVGLDFILPAVPWFGEALLRAQDHQIDFGFGPVPTLTVEDILLSKFLSLRNDAKRFTDLDDLQSIFRARHPLDLNYLSGQMTQLKIPVPEAVLDQAPHLLQKTSKTVRRLP